jgi:hypothetical protein
MSDKDWSTCPRCGAVVDHRDKHKRWHEKLEGTSEPEKGTPGKGRVIVLD